MGEYGVSFQNEPMDVSEEFARQENHFFVGSKVQEFDPHSASGKVLWKGRSLMQRVSYHQLTLQLEDQKVFWEDLPPNEYEDVVLLRGRVGWTVRTAAGGQQDA